MTAVTQLISGQPADVSAGINNIGLGQRPSGPGAESVRGYFTADPNESKGRDKSFNYETIRLPSVAEAGPRKGLIRITS